jgi:glycosyltransferase involved in cell wall biosynthesis
MSRYCAIHMIVTLIPALNEAKALAQLLPALPERLDGRPVRPVVINDGSTDATADVARAHGARVIDLWPTRGKSAALRTGIHDVRSRAMACLVLMDGDGQHDPAELGRLTRPVLAGECDIACGSRYLAQRGRGPTPRNRYLVRSVVASVLSRRLGVVVTDPFSGYRCLAPTVAATWVPRGDRYQAELELLFDAVRNGWSLREVAITRIYTDDCSKMGDAGGPLIGRLRVLGQYAAVMATRLGEAGRPPEYDTDTPVGRHEPDVR